MIIIEDTYRNLIKHLEAKMNINCTYEGWNFNSGNYSFTTDTK